ncbi:MAG: hypothetical protein PUB22_04605 [Clostridiales bacterium]|nr:hypothetical protein [Clostridiales bacterium]
MNRKTVLFENSKKFNIAGYTISASLNPLSINEPVIIPGSFMAFESHFSGKPDFDFRIDSSVSFNRGKKLFQADNFMRTSIYEADDDFWNWVWLKNDGSEGMSFLVKKDFSEVVLLKNDSFQGNLMRELGFMFAYAVLQKNACVLHGITMEYHGKGILILAKSGTGKSTHARIWRDSENALIINGDRCLCRFVDGTWYAYGMPWCGTSGEYINRRVPINAIIFLERGDSNICFHVPSFDGTFRLMEAIKAPNWDRMLYLKAMDYCEELAESIPMFVLQCTPDLESVKVLKSALAERGILDE